MDENTYISDLVDTIEIKHACKKVLSSKEIAARILKAIVPEYKNCVIYEIIQYISDISISSEPVDGYRCACIKLRQQRRYDRI